MLTKQFPARLSKDIADNFNFQQALKRLAEGKPETPRSWVYEDRDPAWILQSWESRLTLLEGGDLKKISEWDLSKSDKFSSQGAVAPFEERQHTLSEYWSHLDDSPIFHSQEWQKAKAMAVSSFGFNRTGTPRLVEEVIKKGLSEDKYNTSSGDPLFLKRNTISAIEQALHAAKTGAWKSYYPVLGARASMGKTGPDARWIFMFPMSVNLVEQTFQQVLQDYIRSKHIIFFTPWEGWDAVQMQLSSWIPSEEAFDHEKMLKFGCDYTKMDQHFNFHHAEQCYDVIKEYFQPRYWDDLYESIHYTFFCDVVAPDYLISGPHAMPSGSGWTNFLETVFNFILLHYVAIKHGLGLGLAMGIGDDQIWFPGHPTIIKTGSSAYAALELTHARKRFDDEQKLADFIVSIFKSVGLDANPEKQEVSYDMVSFLQRHAYTDWSPSGIKYAGVYPTIRALTSEIYPEFYHNEKDWTKNTFALRCLMILENCKYHPLFTDFCIFIAEGNKNIPEFCLSADADILLTRESAKKIRNFLPTYTQASLSMNPTHFESLRVIREHFKKT
nr:MAG: putative RNA-dependent RNA polymerase [Picobirnavirus sp.]